MGIAVGSLQGLWTDPITGISYARARWYDARTASWLSEDPLQDVDSPNLYAFVGWRPSMAADPLGTEEKPAEICNRLASFGIGETPSDSELSLRGDFLNACLAVKSLLGGRNKGPLVPNRPGPDTVTPSVPLPDPDKDPIDTAFDLAKEQTSKRAMLIDPRELEGVELSDDYLRKTAKFVSRLKDLNETLSEASELDPGTEELDQPILPDYESYSESTTYGIYRTERGDVPLVSGYGGPSQQMPTGTSGMHNRIKSHVEAHAASIMRITGEKEATLFINKPPCTETGGCEEYLERMLPEGAVLHVIGPDGYSKTFKGIADPNR